MMRSAGLLLCACWILPAQQPAANSGETLHPYLPGWLSFGGEYRSRLEGFENGAFKPANSDAYLLSRLRLDLTVKPLPWLRIFAQGQDARVFWKNQNPAAVPYQDTFNLRQAYVEVGTGEVWSIRTGRQELNFGEQRLVGSLNWLNTARSFDAVVGAVRWYNVRATAFASSVVDLKQDGEFHHHTQGNDLHGVYTSIGKLVPGAVLEPYWFWRLSPLVKSEAGTTGKLNMSTFGFRLAGKLPQRFNYSMEVVDQKGSRSTDHVSAWAGHWQLARPLYSKGWQPSVSAEYNFATGDGTAKDGTNHTFDPLYPTPHDKYGLADHVGWRNIHHVRAGAEGKPAKGLRVQANYHSWWLANSHDALYGVSGNPFAILADGRGGSHVGQELDTQAFYTVNRQVQLGAGVGHIFPGQFLRAATPGKSYTYPYLLAQYTF